MKQAMTTMISPGDQADVDVPKNCQLRFDCISLNSLAYRPILLEVERVGDDFGWLLVALRSSYFRNHVDNIRTYPKRFLQSGRP